MTETEALILFADTERSADLYNAIPLAIIDPFFYAEADGRKVAVVGALERDRITSLGSGIEVLDPAALGHDELLSAGYDHDRAAAEIALRACREIGITDAVVPPSFPVSVADHLRAGDVDLTVSAERFSDRRRRKTERQLAGIRRAQKAADAAMAAATQLLRDLPRDLTCEAVRTQMQRVCAEHEADLADDVIVSHGAQTALGHESGTGPIVAGEIVLIDIWPRDKKTRCYADMTRTFVAGGGPLPDELERYWTLCRTAIEAVMPELRAGADGRALYELACAPFEAAGQPTQLTKKPGEALDRGFYHGLGHGVGLEIHEPPNLGRSGGSLAAGDVITIEPGCYRPGFGGCRLEDLVVITDNGYELLTDFPYELTP